MMTSSPTPFHVITQGNTGQHLQYKRKNSISMINSLRMRGGGVDGGSDADDGPRRQRRRRKKKRTTETESTTTDTSDEPSSVVVDNATAVEPELVVGSNEEGGSSSDAKKRGKKRRSKLSRIFGNKSKKSNGTKEDHASTKGEEDAAAPQASIMDDEGDSSQAAAAASDEIIIEGGSTAISSGGTKKKRRKRRAAVKEGDDEADSVDRADSSHQNGSTEINGSVPETQASSQDDDTTTEASAIKKKKRKRRSAGQKVSHDDDKSSIQASELIGGDSIIGEPIDVPSEDTEGELSLPQEDEAGSLDKQPKKKRKRKRRSTKDDANVTDGDEVEDSPASKSQSSSNEINTENPLDPTTSTVAINASIEIPSEEIVPESIGTSVELEEIIPTIIDEPIEERVATSSLGEEEEDESSLGTKKKRRRRRKKTLEIDTNLSDIDKGEAVSTQPTSPSAEISDESTTAAAAELSTSISINASIEIPSEEIVPESIDTVVEIREESMPIEIDLMESEEERVTGDNESPEMESIAADNAVDDDQQEKSESSSTNIELFEAMQELAADADDQEEKLESSSTKLELYEAMLEMFDGMDLESEEIDDEKEATNDSLLASINETSALPVLDDDQTTSGEDVNVTPQSIIEEEDEGQTDDDELQNGSTFTAEDALQTPLTIDASIELPGEEIVPESIDSAVEIDKTFATTEPMEEVNSLDKSDEVNFAVTVTRDEEGADDEPSSDVDEKCAEIHKEDDIMESGLSETTAVSEEVEEHAEMDETNIHDASIEDGALHADDIIELPTDDQIEEENDAQDIPVEEDAIGAQEETNDENAVITKDDGVSDSIVVESPANVEIEVDDAVDDDSAVDEAVETLQDDDNIHASAGNIVTEEMGQTANELELEKMDDDCMTLSIVTWNLAESAPSESDASFFKRFRKKSNNKVGVGSDLIMIGAQECEEIKPRRTEGNRSRHLRRMGIQMLGKDYVPLAIHSLGGIQCALYCHRDVLGDVEMINIADVTCGVGNVLHNKGAIGVYLKMKHRGDSVDGGVAKSSRILLVTGHLAAHVKNVEARNSDFHRIISELEAQAPTRFLRPRRNRDGSPVECDGSHLLSSMDHVFFAGDLNYRVDLPREYMERCIVDIQQCTSSKAAKNVPNNSATAEALMKKLLRRDQLLQTIASGHAFSDFNEGKITFLPTFKFDKGACNYDTSHKQRVPAWTDRIVFRSNKEVRVLEYQSVAEAKHSDHRPVFGTFQLGWGMKEKITRKPKRTRSRRKKN